MEKIRNFELQFKCGQDPKSFTPAPDGPFCPHCSKTVYDFSDKSLEDLLQFFEKRGGSFCGSFTPDQLKPARWWSRWSSAALLLITSLISSEAKAQQVPEVTPEQAIQDVKDFGGAAEVRPSFPGGGNAFLSYIRKNLDVPAGTPEGRVLISFVVDKSGSLRNIYVERGLTKKADAEAVRVIASGPKWTPGIFNGRPVNIRYTVPVYFKIPD
ncbi:MAG TPA: energy transducer TonB [Sphingobacteriaceae bacterium]